MSNMASTIIPKSDQMNSDDLIAGPRTIKITEVKIAPGTEQPVAVHYQGDDGKPYMPCKSMRRVMVAVWGPDASIYAGRSMTLYRDPTVTWGGMEVGGIRISHMSHMEKQTMIVLTATKKTRKPFSVSPLVVPPEPVNTAPSKPTTPAEWAAELIAKIEAAPDEDALHDLAGNASVQRGRNKLRATGMEPLDDDIAQTFTRRFQEFNMQRADEPVVS